MGIEPTTSAWKAEVLPLNYTRNLLFFNWIVDIITTIGQQFNRKLNLLLAYAGNCEYVMNNIFKLCPFFCF
jgi:hypothetical protein